MKTIAIVCVGNNYGNIPYHTYCIDGIKQLVNEYSFDVRVLTDTPEVFENTGCVIYRYEKKIFNYFDKFYFTIRLINEFKRGITYIDCDCIDYLLKIEKYRNLSSQDKVLYLTYWSVRQDNSWVSYQYLKDFGFDKWALPIIDYLEHENFNYSKLETMFERLLYFPVGLDYDKIQYDLEKIEPIFSYSSIYHKNLKKRLIYGHGEGLALSYALDKNGVGKDKIEQQSLFREKYEIIFQNTDAKTLI